MNGYAAADTEARLHKQVWFNLVHAEGLCPVNEPVIHRSGKRIKKC